MAAEPQETRTIASTAWLSGLMLGAVNGVAMLALGSIGLPLLAATLLLIAWKGPRIVATAGFVTGAGLVWTVLFTRTALSCVFADASSQCDAGELWVWIGAASAIFVIGMVGSALVFRRSRLRR